MSLSQKYTWQDFLKAHPEHREKKTKRTSPEGKKAFETAYKAFIKKFLAGNAEKLGREIERAKKHLVAQTKKVKELRKAEKLPRVKLAQREAGRLDAAIARLSKQQEKMKTAQKDF
ncbi:MAG: hypothetical protein V2A66_09330 [Pseudomonadota bacterium]